MKDIDVNSSGLTSTCLRIHMGGLGGYFGPNAHHNSTETLSVRLSLVVVIISIDSNYSYQCYEYFARGTVCFLSDRRISMYITASMSFLTNTNPDLVVQRNII